MVLGPALGSGLRVWFKVNVSGFFHSRSPSQDLAAFLTALVRLWGTWFRAKGKENRFET